MPKLKLLNWKVIIPIINPMIKSAEGEQVRLPDYGFRNKPMRSAMVLRVWRRRSPVTRRLIQHDVIVDSISIWLR